MNKVQRVIGVLVVFFLLLGGAGFNTYGQSGTYSVTACADGLLTGEDLMNLASVPAGHRANGQWVNTGGLTFSDMGANPVITGFVLGQAYTIVWKRNNGQIYTFNVSVPYTATDYQLLNASGTASDVLLCSGSNHTFSVSPTSGVSYSYYIKNVSTGVVTTLSANSILSSYTYSATASTDIYELYAIVRSSDGCKSITNPIKISSSGGIEIQVVGGGSVCNGGVLNFELEVIPFDPSLTYTWYKDGAVISTGSKINTATYGIGDYQVRVVACSTTYSSDIVSVSSYTLPPALINPDGSVTMCSGQALLLEGSMNGTHTEPVSYSWIQNGLSGVSSGTGSTSYFSVSTPGNYEYKIFETNNPLCYTVSDATTLNLIAYSVNSFVANGSTSFCGSISPSITVNVGMDNAIGNITLTITNISTGTSESFTVSNNTTQNITLSQISASAVYEISAISGGGCSASSEYLALLKTITYTRQPDPLIYSVTGTSNCAGTNTVIGLSGSEIGVTYELLRDNVTTGLTISGTGAAISSAWTVNAAGSYTVIAYSGSCPSVLMSGSLLVRAMPVSVSFVNTGLFCPSGEVALQTSYTGTTYLLYRNGVATGATRNGTTGSPVSFGDQSVPGIYTIRATTGGNCYLDLSDELTVQAQPTVYNLGANKLSYCSSLPLSGVTLTLSDTEAGVVYRLYNGASLISTVIGDGNPITWNNQVAGTYSVRASNDGGCTVSMTGTPVITALAAPTATISVASATNRRCETASSSFLLGVALTGTPPFSFDIVNNVGLPVISVVNHNSTIFTPISVNPDQTVTYTIINLTDGSSCGAVTGSGSAQFYVDPLPTITFSPEAPELCFGSAAIPITASGAGTGGTYLWSDGLGSNQTIYVAPPSTQTYTVLANTVNNCSASRPITVTVNPLPDVDFSAPGDDYSVCENGGVITLTPVPTGGSFTGNGIISSSYEFDPDLAGAGSHLITYTYQDAKSCAKSVSKTIVVTAPPVVSIGSLQASYCADDPDDTVYGNPSNSRGVFSLVGHAAGTLWGDNGNGTMWLSPTAIVNSGSGPGYYTVNYSYTDLNGCVSEISQTTQVQEDLGDVVRFRNLPALSCQTEAPVTLQAYFDWAVDVDITTNDGRFSGPGITDHANGTATFDPSVAGNGLHTVQYSYTDPVTGCSASYSQNVQVGTVLTIMNINPIYCLEDGNRQIYGSPVGGTMRVYKGVVDPANLISTMVNNSDTNPVGFNPSAVGSGTYIFEYELITGSCVNLIQYTTVVHDYIDASFTTSSGLTQFCETTTNVTFTTNQPGGNFSGPGVSLNAFNPSLAHGGSTVPTIHTITHTINTGSCSASETIVLTVVPVPVISIVNLLDEYCENEPNPILIQASNMGVVDAVYTFSSTTNVIGRSPLYTLDGLGNKVYASTIVAEQVYFDPTYVSEGFYTVTLNFDNSANNGCSAVYSKVVTVHDVPEVNFGGIADPLEYCQDAGLQTLTGSFVGSGNYVGSGAFVGAGIIDADLNDGIASFDPSLLSPGLYPVSYSYTLSTGCISTRDKNIRILEAPAVYNITPLASVPYSGNYCEGAAGITIGVDFSQVGVSYELVYNNNFTSPVQTIAGDGDAIEFALPVTSPGAYTVRAVSSFGCISKMNGSVQVVMNKVAASVLPENVSCLSGNDGSIAVTASGGSVPYVYKISTDGLNFTEQPINIFSNLIAGTYYIQVTDNIGCTMPAPVEVIIIEPTETILVSSTHVDVGCLPCLDGGDCDGSAIISITGGTTFPDIVTNPSGYSIEWRDASNTIIGSGLSINNKAPGSYSVTVTDAEGCSAYHVVEIGLQPVLDMVENLPQHVDVVCNGADTGSFEVMATGGSGSYEFSLDGVSWYSNGSDTYSFSGLYANTYHPYVRDAAYTRCEYNGVTVVIDQLDTLTLNEVSASHVDVDCYGEVTGQFEVIATGGSGNFEYTIDNGTTWQPSPIFTGLSAGTYFVWVRDANTITCIYKSVEVTILQPSVLNLTLNSVNNVSCYGLSDGLISVTASGGSGNYSYSINGGTSWQLSPLFENLPAGNYLIGVHDQSAAMCEILYAVSVTVTQPLDFSIVENISAHKDVSCFGGNDGSFTVTPTRTGNFGYSIDGVNWSSSPLFSNLAFGGYNVSMRDMATTGVDNCVKVDVINIYISQPANSVTIQSNVITNVSCVGGNDGAIAVTPTGGTSPYSYQWYRVTGTGNIPLGVANTGTSANATALVAGDYMVAVTDDNGCQITASYSITEPASDVVISVVDIDHVTTTGGNNGAIEISITGGSLPYASIIWSGIDMGGVSVSGLTNGVYRQEGLVAGVYEVTVTDSNGCISSIDNIVVSQPGMNLGFIITKTNPQPCNGAANGTINLSVIGGTQPYQSITLTNSLGTLFAKNSSGNNYANYIGLSAGIYIATVVDVNNVSYSENIILTEPDAIVLDFEKIKDVTCHGEANGQVRFRITGGTPYAGDAVNPLIPDNDYYSVTIIPSTGATRSYYVEAGQYFLVDNLTADANYLLTATDINGCLVTEPFAITEPDALSVNLNTVIDVTCFGGTDGEISISVLGRIAGTPFTYNWQRLESGSWVDYQIGGNALLSGLSIGSYHVAVIEMATGCEIISDTYTVNQPTDLIVQAVASDVNTCKGDNSGAIDVSVYGGVAPYVVDYGVGTLSGNGPLFNIPSLPAGPYTITVADNNGTGCVKTANTVINEPMQLLSINNFNANIDCETINSGFVSFEVEGGVSNTLYEYSYTVSLVNSTTGTNYGQVVAPTTVQPYLVNINNLPAGEYVLTVSDRLAATSAACASYVQNISLEHIVITSDVVNATCNGVNTGEIKNIVITGGSGDYSWNWSSSTGGLGIDNANLNQSGLSAGTYELQLLDNVRGCTITKTYDVLFGNNLQVTGSTKGVTCSGNSDGAIYNINVTGVSDPNLIFTWSGPDIGTIVADPADPNLSGLAGGTYILTVVDGNGCSVMKTFTVTVPSAINYDLSTSLDNCDPYSRSVSLNNLSGGTGVLSFVWNGPGGFNNTTQNVTGLTTGGTYSVTVYDENFCQLVKNITIPGAVSVDATIEHINCNGENNASIVLHVSGGSGDYSYSWSTTDGSGISATSKDQENLTAGTYTVVVTDNNEIAAGANCSVIRSFVVTQPLALSITGVKTDVLCAGNNNGTINIDVTGGTGSYTYNWSSANGTGLIQGNKDQVGLSGGTYSVLVQDANGCNSISSFIINEPDALDFTIVSSETDCTGANSIELTNIIGGSGSYLLTWAGPGIPSGFTGTLQQNLPGGIYTIRLTDTGIGQLCTIEKSVTLAKALQVSVATTSETCPGELDGTITLTVTDGLEPYSYNWTTISGSPVVTLQKNQGALSAGEYRVQVTDSRGCMVEQDITINNLHNITVNAVVTNVTCYGAETGAVNIAVNGGSGNYSYQWSSAGFSASTKDISGLRAGGYSVVITDNDFGCQVSQSFAVTQPSSPISVVSIDITDVLCKGNATGAIDITVDGGTLPYSYQWSTTSGALIVINSEDQVNLVDGTYQVRITDALGCFLDAGPYTIVEPDYPLEVAIVEVVNVSIPGESTGSIEINATGGSGGYTYEWEQISPVASVITGSVVRQSGLSAGVYRVTVTDQYGCVNVVDNITVTEPGLPLTIYSSHKNVRPCNGSDNGEIQIDIVGGTPDMSSGSAAYHIILSNGSVVAEADDVNLSVENLPAGWYSVVVTDVNNVTQSTNIEITQPPVMLFTVDVVNNVTCYGGSDAIIRVNVSGGSPVSGGNYQIQLVGGGFNITRVSTGVNEDFTNLPQGSYTVMVWDDADGDGLYSSANSIEDDCFKSQSVTVLQPEAEAVLSVVTGSEDICEGVLPQLQIIVSGWGDISSNQLTATLNDGSVVTVNDSPFVFQPSTAPLSGVYTYSIVSLEADGTSCLKGNGTGSAVVTVRPLPTARIFGNPRICAGETAQISVDLTGTAPWSIIYTDGTNVGTINNITNSLYLIDVSPLVSSSYQLTSVSDAYCSNSGTGTANVQVDELPVVTLSGEASSTICRGENTNLNFDFSAGIGPWVVTYESVIDVNGTAVVTTHSFATGITPYVLPVSPSVTTTYRLVSVTDNNGGSNSCMGSVGSQDVIVTVNQYPVQPLAISGNTEVCQGETVAYSVPVTDYAVGYIWELPVGATLISGGGSRSIEVYFDSATSVSGYLRVRGTNGCGVGLSREVYINVNKLPASIGAITGPTEMCQGTTRASYSVIPVSDATGYTWVVPAGFTIQGQGTASILVDIDSNINSFTGQITVTPYNDCGASLATALLGFTVYSLPTANAGFDENICSDTYKLNAASLPADWTGRWEVVSGMGSATIVDPTSPTSDVTNISRGNVTFRWTVTHTHSTVACSVYDDVIIRNNILAVNATTPENVVCDGESVINGTVVPTGYSNTEGLWQAVYPVGSPATFDAATSPSTNVRNLVPGLNRLRWTLTQNGCESYAEVEITNNSSDQAVISGLSEIDLCTDVTTLTANSPVEGTGKWSIIQGFGAFSSTADASVTVSDIAMGTNIFRWTITKGNCSSYDEVIVRNNKLLVTAGDEQLICTDNTILEGTEPPLGVTGQWSVVSGGPITFDDGTLYNTAVSNLGYGVNELTWTLTKNGCQSSANVIITSNRPTSAEVGSLQTICGTTTTLTGNTAVVGSGRWSVISGAAEFADPQDPITEVSGLDFGNNVLRWTITNNGCSLSADLTINNLQVYVYAGKDTVICGRVTQLKGNEPVVGSGLWQMVSGMGGATFQPGTDVYNPTVGGLDYGNNGFVWTITNNGCVSRDTVVIINNAPYPVEAGGDQVIDGSVTTLNATPPTIGSGFWELISGGGNVVDPSNPYSQVISLRRGDNVFRWTVTHMNCSDYDEVIVTNGETIDANAGKDQEVCTNYTTLEANDPDVAIGKWSVVSGSGSFEDIYNPETKVTNIGYGQNIFRWTIYYTTSSNSDDVIILNNMSDQANAGYDDVVCDNQYKLQGNIPKLNMGTGLWTLYSGGGVFDDPTLADANVTELGFGENRFIYSISKGSCVSTDTVAVINGLPTDAEAGNDDTVCENFVTLKPNTPTYGVGSWRVGSVGSATFTGNDAKNLAQGPNILIWEISTGYCSSTDTITITNNSPTVSYAGQSRDICDTVVALSATPAVYGTGLWELVYGSGTISDPLSPQTVATGLAKGENTFRWTVDNNGCTSVSTVVFTNNLLDANAGGAQAFCADTTMLEANNPLPGVGTWGLMGGSGSANFDDLNDPYTIVRNLDQGENLLTWTIDYKGCQSVSVVSVTNNNPSKANAGTNDATCESSYVLAGNLPEIGSATWTIREGGGDFSSFTDPSAKVDNLKFGANIFRWTIQHENCTSFDDVEIDFNRIDANAGKDQARCADNTTLEANSAIPGVGVWTVPGGQGAATFADINNPVTSVSELRKGDNLLRWTISYKGCVTFDDVTITNNLPSSAYAGNNQTFCGTETTLDATPVTIGTGEWSVGTGSAVFTNDNDPKTAASGLAQGENLLIWKVTNGLCSLEDQVLITNNQPSEPYAGLDYEEICDNSFQLKAATPDYGVGTWTFLDGGGNLSDTTDPNAIITSLSSGTNRLRWTLSSGQCSLSDEIVIQNNTPTKANAGSDIDDCKDSQMLDGNVPVYGTGLWERVSGYGDFVDDTDPKTRVDNLKFGENIFRWTISNGKCFSSDQVVIINKTPDKSFAGNDQTFCENYTVLNANDPTSGVGTWSVIKGKGTFTDSSAFDTPVKDVGFGENIYQWKIVYGECSTTDEVTIVSNMADAYAGEDQIVYEPTAVLNATNAGTLNALWYLTGNSTAVFENAAFFNTRVNNLTAGVNTFKWEIDVNGCIASDYVSIDYREVPDASFITDVDAGCYPLTVTFTNYSVGGSTFYWDFGDGNSSGDRNPVYTFQTPGRFTVTLTSPGPDGHNGVSTKIINVYDHPVASFSVNPQLVYVPGDKVRFYDLSTDPISWLWQFGDGNSSDLRNPLYEYQNAGTYDVKLTVANKYGCVDSLTIEDAVIADDAGFIVFPNAFKPRPGESAGTNVGTDNSLVFKPVYRDVDTYLLQIFNRWGQLIYQSTEIDEGWDGLYEGELSPQAVYVYKASGTYLNGREYRKTGSVLLVR